MKAQTNTLSAEEAELLKVYQKLGSDEKADLIELMKILLKNQSASGVDPACGAAGSDL